MITWVSIADLHLSLHDKWGKLNPETGLNTRLEDRLSNIETAVEYALEKKVDYFIIAGDIFDSLNPGERLRGLFMSCVAPLAAAEIKVVIIIGDHDTDGKLFNFMAEGVNAENMINFQIVGVEPFEENNLVFVSFNCIDQIVGIKNKNKKVLFSHLSLDGAKIQGGTHRLRTVHPRAMVKDFLWFELGDIHQPQEFRNGCYIGSIAKKDFGERNEEKGFRYGYLKVKDEASLSEFISVADRMFVQLDIEERTFETLKQMPSEMKSHRGAILKVIVTGTRDWIKSVRWPDYRIQLQQHYSIVKFEYNYVDRDADKVIEKKPLDNDLNSLENVIRAYGKESKMSKEEIEFGLGVLDG